MRLVKRVTAEEKHRIHVFCEDHGISQSEFFSLLINRALASVKTEKDEKHLIERKERKERKITIRLNSDDFERVDFFAKSEGFPNKTVWLRSILLSKINQEPILSNEELIVLRESNRQISAIGRNLNQIAKALNIEFRESDKLKKEHIDMLTQSIEEHKKNITDLISIVYKRGV